ncbi:hypothetical protein Syun_006076 [Stephania yunnanensis]|uniref:6-phosphogluconate dehydrogenase NADP-binding domain-containing protein n=1 Tax=Stephania yunnanensis TaxID=152371 RepID=A0AAP0KYI4_9MAGN
MTTARLDTLFQDYARTTIYRNEMPTIELSLLNRTMSIATAPAAIAATTEPITPATTCMGWIGTGVVGQSMYSHLIYVGFSLTIFTRTH